MRYFPSPRHRRTAVASLAGVVLLALTAFPHAFADDDLKKKQHQVQHQVEQAHQDLDESSAALRQAMAALSRAKASLLAAQGRLAVAQGKVAAARILDQQMQAKLVEAEQRLATTREELAAGQADVAKQRVNVGNTLTEFYADGDPQLLALTAIMGAHDFSEVTRQLDYMDTVVGLQTQTFDQLRAAEVLLTVREGQVEDARDDVATQRAAAAAHLVEMRKLEEEAAAAAESVRQLVVARATAEDAAYQVKKHDLALLHQLKKEEDRIKQLIIERAQKARGGYHGATNGILNMPVDGPVTSPYGWRIHPIYGYWGLHDGTDFGADCREPLWAVASGRVLEEYYSEVWGNRLYLDLGNFNGKNVTVIYNHMSSYKVGVGEHVSRGDTVGRVGTTGWSTGCHLHFTLMVNGNPVDPMPWIGDRS